ncbi:acyl-CoA dehydrogenase family protein [Caldiplasma sukawensis]
MDFELDKEILDFRDKVRKFAEENLTSELAKSADEGESYPETLRKKAHAMGLFDFTNPWKVMTAIEELCAVDPGLGISATVPYFGAEVLLLHGSDHLKDKYLSKVMSGEKVMGLGVTEPGGGSDVAGLKTVAEKKGNKYIINGGKMFITNGSIADFFVTLVRTSPPDNPSKRHHGLSVFVVERDFKGFKSNKLKGKLGVRATDTAELIYENMEVPEENLVGEEGKGFYYIMEFFNISRIYVAAQSIGIARGAMERAAEYIRQKESSGKAVSEDKKFKLADIATRIEASRLLMYKAASYLFNFKPNPTLTSMAKGYASETATMSTEFAMDIMGSAGRYSDLERFFRDSKIMEIWEGTSEVEKIIISRNIVRGEY